MNTELITDMSLFLPKINIMVEILMIWRILMFMVELLFQNL